MAADYLRINLIYPPERPPKTPFGCTRWFGMLVVVPVADGETVHLRRINCCPDRFPPPCANPDDPLHGIFDEDGTLECSRELFDRFGEEMGRIHRWPMICA